MKILDDLCEFIVDCEHKTAPIQEIGIPSIRTPNIGRGFLILDGVNLVSDVTYEAWTRRAEPTAGDLILAREAPVGNVAVVPDNLKCCLGQRTVLIRPKNTDVDSDYLCYLLLTPALQGDLLGKSGGATVHHLNLKDIRALPIPELPTVEIQKAKASIIKAYYDLIETNRRRITLLEESAKLLYREWIAGCDMTTHTRASWKRTKLESICDLIKDQADPGKVAPDTPYLSMEHMTSKSISLAEWETAGKVSSLKLHFKSGDVLFGRIRAYFHKVGIAQISGITSTDMLVVRAKTQDLLPLVALTMSSDEFVAHAVVTSNGTKMPRADWKVLKAWELLIPPPSEISEFAAKVLPIFRLLEVLSTQNRRLTEARDALLPKLMSGEIQV